MDARCQCGAVQARVDDGARPFTTMCHCLACQRRSGSPFGAVAYFRRDLVHILGEVRAFTRGSDAGTSITNGFCPGCGSTIYILLEKNPDLMGVPVGAFGDRDFPPPVVSVWEREQHRWLALPHGIRRFVQGTDAS